VSTYTDNAILAHTPKGREGQGVYAISCSADGKLSAKATSALGPNVAFLVKHPTKNKIYASTECINKDGEILTTTLDHETGELQLQGRVGAGGKSTCYLNLHQNGRFLTAVNYWDAKLATFGMQPDGSVTAQVHSDMQPGAEYVDTHNPTREEHWKYRQRWPHTHCMVTEPYSTESRSHFVIDLGVDQVLQYQADAATGALTKVGAVQLTRHLGPRHIVFHPRVKAAYLVNELNSTVSVFKVNLKPAGQGQGQIEVEDSTAKGATLQLIQTLSTLPSEFANNMSLNEHGVWKAASHASEIRLHPSGRFLYVGNRGHDSIACFGVEDTGTATGLLTLVDVAESGGKTPRNFNFSGDGRHLLVGNQDSNNVTLFAIDAAGTGALSKKSALPVPSPNYVYGIPSCGAGSKSPSKAQTVKAVAVTKKTAANSTEVGSSKKVLGTTTERVETLNTFNAAFFIFLFIWFVCYAWLNVGHQFDL
jgi:6-phosphogluconolactonase